MPGVSYVLEGKELAEGTTLLAAGLDTPNVPRRPLAVDVARYAGEWVAAVVAETRALAEDAAEAVVVEYEPLPFVLDAEEAYAGGTLVHEAHEIELSADRRASLKSLLPSATLRASSLSAVGMGLIGSLARVAAAAAVGVRACTETGC